MFGVLRYDLKCIIVCCSWNFKLCFDACCGWKFSYVNYLRKWHVELFIFYKESMCYKHDSWNEMYWFKAWGKSIWTLNMHRSEVHSPRKIIHGLNSHEVPTWVSSLEVLTKYLLGLDSFEVLDYELDSHEIPT
jgi:hypothetical protein